jgi:hypothetical protein
VTCAGTGCGVNHACACGVQLSQPRTPARRPQRGTSDRSSGGRDPLGGLHPLSCARCQAFHRSPPPLSPARSLPLRGQEAYSRVHIDWRAIDPGTTIWRRPELYSRGSGAAKAEEPSMTRRLMSTRRTILGLALGMVTCSIAAAVTAQPAIYPSRPVKVIVPFVAGGTTDIFARLIGEKLSQSLGQQFVIENRGGRRWQHRCGCSREGRARRLHVGDGHRWHARHQCEPLRQDAIRPPDRFRTRRLCGWCP